MTLQEALTQLADSLSSKANPRREAEDILMSLLACSRTDLYVHRKDSLEDACWQTASQYVKRRLAGEPLAYIHGSVEFYGCLLLVNSSVLIPRPETEVLVDKIAQELKREKLDGKVLLDLCCGSGCMGIALKKAFPKLTVLLSDVSEKALNLASENAKNNHVSVECLLGDLLTPLKERKVDFCVCNPPYIADDEFEGLDPEVKDFEPSLALRGGREGLDFYQRLAKDLPSSIQTKGKAWLEMGYQQGMALEKLFTIPPWKVSRFENDWAGHHRFFFLENE